MSILVHSGAGGCEPAYFAVRTEGGGKCSQHRCRDQPAVALPFSRFLIALIFCGLLFSPPDSSAQTPGEVETAFKQFMRLALKNPTSYGFADEAEAVLSRLGRCYGFYSTAEWAEAYPRMSAQDLANPDLAPEKAYEVNAPCGETRCTFVWASQPDTKAFKPVLLGRPDIARSLHKMSAKSSRERLVLILDVEQRKLFYSDALDPKSVLEFH